MAADCGVLAAAHRVMAAQMRTDLVFPTEAAAAGYCVKMELVELTIPTPLSLGRVAVAALGHHLPPVLREQDLLRLGAATTAANTFASPLLIDVEDVRGAGLQAKFFSVIDVNLFLQFRGAAEEERSLGSLRWAGLGLAYSSAFLAVAVQSTE